MFKAALLRLTLGYLALIMLLSLAFSIALYHVSSAQLDLDQQRQQSLLHHSFRIERQPGFSAFNTAMHGQLDQSRQDLERKLIYFNLCILVLGGGLSYLLARRTLHPIEESHGAQQRFSADASHELRTPLTAMKTEIEVGLRDPNLTLSQSKELHRSTLEEVAKLETLSKNLLKLAQQSNNKSKATFASCAVKDIINQAITQVKPLAQKKQIQIKTLVNEESVYGEEWSLVELITVLLDNAIKYSEANTQITLTTTSLRHKPEVAIIIDDQGNGIKDTDLPLIFNRFYRSDRSRTGGSMAGHGLGLSIAKKIIDLHHGRIEVKSRVGKGSTFTVILPIHHPKS